MDRRRREEVMPLAEFPRWKQDEIADLVAQPLPPAKWLNFGLMQMPSRAWYEWHWQRGKYPGESRSRPAIPLEVRRAVFARDGDTCQICFEQVPEGGAHLDHIKPYSRGGPDTVENLRVTHALCNIKRGAPIEDPQYQA